MKTVYKYQLRFDKTLSLSLPKDAKVVYFSCPYDGDPKMWIELDPEFNADNYVTRYFQIFGTGHTIPDTFEHWGTCLMTDGAFVWHLYEEMI